MKQRWTARTLPPDLADTSRWRLVDSDALDDKQKERFLNFQAAITAYLETGKISAISEERGISKNNIVRQLNRCVTLAADGKPYGWSALISQLRTGEYERKAKLPLGRQGSRGNRAGAFRAFIALHPEIKRKIDNLIFKRSGKGEVHEARIAIKNIHAAFVSYCEDAGITGNQYPLNSKSCGKRSIARYVNDALMSSSEEACRTRFGAIARSHMNVGRGRQSSAMAHAPFDVVGIDPHKLDCIGTVRITGPKGPQHVAIERLWIVPAVDDHSRAILGYSVGIRTECSAAIIEHCIISAMSAWKPRELKIPKMVYAPGAGLPSGKFPELIGRAWAMMMVDNAAVHYSSAIAERARRRLGCAVNYGPIGHWEHRPSLERVMRTLEGYGFQRLPSTTGNSPTDPTKDDPVRNAVVLGIDWEILLDMIDVIIANYNATPNEALGNRSPLSLLHDYVEKGSFDFLPRRLPPVVATIAELGVTIETKTVRGNLKQGRRPYVEIDRVRYTSPLLSSTFNLVGKKLRVHIRESNMCSVHAYHESGEELGILQAQGAWGRTIHTREMRKQINALRDSFELVVGYQENPIVAFLNYLGSATHKEAEKKPMQVSRSATKLVQAAHESGMPVVPESCNEVPLAPQQIQPILSIIPSQSDQSKTRTLSVLVKPPLWKTVIR
ncbi:hypothetical protein [Undibacterium sp. TJN19]|uniref:hypothetical protein n=1 Tax=Undibacterium sp. TJN19 TaxID=3413055 RepID=UPI003BF31F64